MTIKKLFLISMTIALLFCTFMIPNAGGFAEIASRYHFKTGDTVCVRKSAFFYENIDGKWLCAENRPNVNVGTIKSIRTVELTFPQNIKVSFPEAMELTLQSDFKPVTLYEIASGVKAESTWVNDVAPTITYVSHIIIFDANKGAIHVNLTTSDVRKAVLSNALDIAKALKQEHKKLGYEKYFKVDIEYFAWELIAHAYAAEYGLPGYWESSIADCNVSDTDVVTKAMIEIARALWKNGPEKTW